MRIHTRSLPYESRSRPCYIQNGMGITALQPSQELFWNLYRSRARGKSRRSGKSRSNVEVGSNARRWPTDRAMERGTVDPGIVLYRTKTWESFPLACMYAPVEKGGRRKNRKKKKDETVEGCGKYWEREGTWAPVLDKLYCRACFCFSNVRRNVFDNVLP